MYLDKSDIKSQNHPVMSYTDNLKQREETDAKNTRVATAAMIVLVGTIGMFAGASQAPQDIRMAAYVVTAVIAGVAVVALTTIVRKMSVGAPADERPAEATATAPTHSKGAKAKKGPERLRGSNKGRY